MKQEILNIPTRELGKDSDIEVEIVGTEDELYRHFAWTMFDIIQEHNRQGRSTSFILPVGPVGQYKILAKMCNEKVVSCRDLICINMDEYCNYEGTALIDYDHPLSFRKYMDKSFYSLLNEENKVRPANKVFPEFEQPEKVTQLVEKLGGVDICFGGVGITGHLAFNEPVSEEEMTAEQFAELPTRLLDLDIRTRTINSVTAAAGHIPAIPKKAVTIGMKEILQSKKINIYMNREWQSVLIRRILYDKLSPEFPVTLLQKHESVKIIITEQVAQIPQIRLR